MMPCATTCALPNKNDFYDRARRLRNHPVATGPAETRLSRTQMKMADSPRDSPDLLRDAVINDSSLARNSDGQPVSFRRGGASGSLSLRLVSRACRQPDSEGPHESGSSGSGSSLAGHEAEGRPA